jgi:hypothetical protein
MKNARLLVRMAVAGTTTLTTLLYALHQVAAPATAQVAPAEQAPISSATAQPPSQSVVVKMRFLTVIKQPDGSLAEQPPVFGPIISTVAGKSASVGMSSPRPDGTGWQTTTEVTPDVNGDGSITLHVVWRERSMENKQAGERTRINHEAAFTRRTDLDKPVRVELMSMGPIKYFVEVTPATNEVREKSGPLTRVP